MQERIEAQQQQQQQLSYFYYNSLEFETFEASYLYNTI